MSCDAVVDTLWDIRWFENIGHSAAWSQVPAYMAELQSAGLAESPMHGPAWNDAAVVYYDGHGRAVGWLAYRVGDYVAGFWIIAAYVLPDWRGNGVHTALFEALVKLAKEKGDIIEINCGTHVNNKAAQKAFERQGRELIGYQYRYVVRPYVEGTPV